MNSRFIQADIHSEASSNPSNALNGTQYGDDQGGIRDFKNPAGNHNGIIPRPHLVPPVSLNPGVLNSWKEIATYLGRGVRTVQRWESELQLPIHRPRGKNRSAVVAFRKELDDWLRATPLQRADDDGRDAVLQIARDLQSLAVQLVGAINSQPQTDGKKLVEATNTILQRLSQLTDDNSGQAIHTKDLLSKSS
ncbi:MAG: helix-turn-helix domain-containing protein [Candidatus Angelobacter sp.]